MFGYYLPACHQITQCRLLHSSTDAGDTFPLGKVSSKRGKQSRTRLLLSMVSSRQSYPRTMETNDAISSLCVFVSLSLKFFGKMRQALSDGQERERVRLDWCSFPYRLYRAASKANKQQYHPVACDRITPPSLPTDCSSSTLSFAPESIKLKIRLSIADF